jgi:hypothetical protein
MRQKSKQEYGSLPLLTLEKVGLKEKRPCERDIIDRF